VVDDEHLAQALLRLEFESELFLHGRKDRWTVRVNGWSAIGRMMAQWIRCVRIRQVCHNGQRLKHRGRDARIVDGGYGDVKVRDRSPPGTATSGSVNRMQVTSCVGPGRCETDTASYVLQV
jgi:hypothetical protein